MMRALRTTTRTAARAAVVPLAAAALAVVVAAAFAVAAAAALQGATTSSARATSTDGAEARVRGAAERSLLRSDRAKAVPHYQNDLIHVINGMRSQYASPKMTYVFHELSARAGGGASTPRGCAVVARRRGSDGRPASESTR